ncbi:MAG: CocE/NonD family hydrolase [Xanthomonadales bacterium]|nr:CocE/NonD family hydrolase [Xanthomonadales bacterium]
MISSRLPLSLALTLCACVALAQPASFESAIKDIPDLPEVQLSWGLQIPLRDGVKLNATRYRKAGSTERVPCIFTLTPYIAQNYHDRGMYFAANGYVFLSIDTRGRGNSGGEFTPLLQEAKDGHDVVEWLAQQDFCNGKVTMWGGSYAGYNQWATAKEFPRGLATIVPVASPYAGIDFPMNRNIPYSYDIQWLTLTAGKAAQDKIFGDAAYWASVYKRWYLSGRPFRELDRFAGMPSKHFQKWIDHPAIDAYWDSYNPTPAQFARLDLPILSITGQYDGDQPGALEFWTQFQDHASAAAKDKHWLIIGPWDHAGTRTPLAEFGGAKFAEQSVMDLNALHKQWYDWTMKDGAKPEFLKSRVAWYQTGREEWRYADSLEGLTAARKPLYLHSIDDRANDVFLSGALLPEPEKTGGIDSYVYDPRDTAPAALADDVDAGDLRDQRAATRNGGRSLIYHTAPFEADTDLAGFFSVRAFIELDQPDTDFNLSIHEVRPDGSALFLASEQRRARYRESAREAKLVEPGAVLEYHFDKFTFMARTIPQGSRLRLVVEPINTPYSQRNHNTGGVVADETLADARTVTVKLHHGPERPSVLELPLAAASLH